MTKFLDMVYGLKICDGTVSNIEAKISKALESTYNALSEELQKQDIVHADETRQVENNKTHWAWVGTNTELTVFKFNKSRGKNSSPIFPGIPLRCEIRIKSRRKCAQHN